MLVNAKLMSGEVLTFELGQVGGFTYLVKKLRHLLSSKLHHLPESISIYKDEEPVDDTEVLSEDMYTIFVNV